MKRIKNGHGRTSTDRPSNKPAPTPAPVTGLRNAPIELSYTDSTTIRALEDVVVQAKTALADLTVQRTVIENNLTQTVHAFQVAQAAYLDSVRKVALSHGIDPDADPEVVGRWNLDTKGMTLSRIT